MGAAEPAKVAASSGVRRRRGRRAGAAGPAVEPPPGLEALPIAVPLGEDAGALQAPGLVAPPPGLGPPGLGPPGLEPPGAGAGPGVEVPRLDRQGVDDGKELVAHAKCDGAGNEAQAAGATDEPVACHVTIGGLPNGILSEPMMLATIQQAGLEGDVLHFSTHEGQPCGEARLAFSSFQAALRCSRHFEGCHWDPSGKAVTVSMEPSIESMSGQVWEAAAALAGANEMEQPPDDAKHLRAEAPAFKPVLADIAEENQAVGPRARLSAAAPAFVPAVAPAAEAQAASASLGTAVASAPTGGAPGAKLGVSSDTSTEMGDSDAEDEKGSLVT